MEAPRYEIFNEAAKAPLLFLCDHASPAVPAELGTLGLPAEAFDSHIAYDIGAANLTRELADRFGAPAVLARYSRLVVDLNRGTDDPTVVMRLSDGRIVPGNRDLGPADIARRIAAYHAPYHAAVAARIAAAREHAVEPVLISIHSFTPVWRGARRPWRFGVLWDRDDRLAAPLMRRLAATGARVGDNEPYTGALENDCMYRHGTMNGLPHVLIEVRQDLIADQPGIDKIAATLDRALNDALAEMGPAGRRYSRALPGPANEGGQTMDERTRTEIEAAVFRRLVAHLQTRTDVQNIDMMNLAGFCRNCLGDWYREAAGQKGIALEKDEARAVVYGMAPAEWKRRYQKEATPEAVAAFAKSQAKTHS